MSNFNMNIRTRFLLTIVGTLLTISFRFVISEDVSKGDSRNSVHQLVKRQAANVEADLQTYSSTLNPDADADAGGVPDQEAAQTNQYQPERQSSGRHYVSPNGRPYYEYRPPVSSGRGGAIHQGSIARSQTYNYPFGHSSQSSSTSHNQEWTGSHSSSGGGAGIISTAHQEGNSGAFRAEAQRQQELRRRLYEQQRLRLQASRSANGTNAGQYHGSGISGSFSSVNVTGQASGQGSGTSHSGQIPSFTAYSQRRVVSTSGGSGQSSQNQHTRYQSGQSNNFPSGYQTSSGNQYQNGVLQTTRYGGSTEFNSGGYQGQGQGQGYGTQTRRHHSRGGSARQWPHETGTSQQVNPRLLLTTQTGRYPGYRTRYSTGTAGQLGVEEIDDPECPNTGINLSIDGLSCQQAIHHRGSYLCYVHEYTSRECCQACKVRRRPENVGCEYGDHASMCSTIVPSDCYDLRNQASCCETCQRYRRRDAIPGCEYGDQTPRCDAVRQNPGLCYVPDNQRLCCQTCGNMRNQTNPSCPWGDYNSRLCQLFDSRTSQVRINCYSPQRQRICCQSCERLRNWIPNDVPSDCPYGDRPAVFSTSQYGRLTCSNLFNFFDVNECRTNVAVASNCCYTCHRLLSQQRG